MLKPMVRTWSMFGLVAIHLSMTTARPSYPLQTPQITYDEQKVDSVLHIRSEAKRVTAAVVGTTTAVGVFILVLLGVAIYLWRRRQLRLADEEAGMTASSSSPRAQIYRKQRRRSCRPSKPTRRRRKGEKNGRRRIRTLRTETTALNRRLS